MHGGNWAWIVALASVAVTPGTPVWRMTAPSVHVAPVDAVRRDSVAAASVESRFAGVIIVPDGVPVNVNRENNWRGAVKSMAPETT